MSELTSSRLFGIVLCIVTFEIGVWVQKKLKTPLANPLVIAIALCITVLSAFRIPYDNFNQGGQFISMLLAPATAVLALSIYSQREVLKQHFLPIAVGCLMGSLTSVVSVVLLCRAFGIDDRLMVSLMPKSVTTAIAVGISEQHGGMVSITVAAVVVTGVLGAVFAPLLIRLFRVKNPVAMGVAIGTSSHAVGTARALEIGDIQGAMSSLAIGITGLITCVISLFW